jgi:hypothetical protein
VRGGFCIDEVAESRNICRSETGAKQGIRSGDFDTVIAIDEKHELDVCLDRGASVQLLNRCVLNIGEASALTGFEGRPPSDTKRRASKYLSNSNENAHRKRSVRPVQRTNCTAQRKSPIACAETNKK